MVVATGRLIHSQFTGNRPYCFGRYRGDADLVRPQQENLTVVESDLFSQSNGENDVYCIMVSFDDDVHSQRLNRDWEYCVSF